MYRLEVRVSRCPTAQFSVHDVISLIHRVLELQAFLAELISKFEFSMTPEAHKVRRESCLVMTPTIEGQLEKGTQLPLRIQIASREESVFSK